MINLKTYYNKIPKTLIKRSILVIGVLFLISLVGGIIIYQKRGALLAEAIAKVKEKAKKEYQINLQIDNASFAGLSTVVLNGVKVTPENRDQLASIKHLEISVRLFPLLTGKIKVSQINGDNASLTLIKRDSLSNYDFIFKSKSKPEDSLASKSPIDLGKLADRMINNVFYKIPDNMELNFLEMSYKDDSLFQNINIPQTEIIDGKLKSIININNTEATWHLEGDLNPGDKKLYFKLFAEGKKVELPILQKKYGLKLNFDTLETHLEQVKWRIKDELLMSGSWKVKNLLVNHWRIASNDVIVPDGFIDAEVIIGKDFVALDKASEMKVAKLVFFPSAKLTLRPHKTFGLGVRTDYIPSQDVFDSFPRGLFTTLEGIRVSGKMNYKLDFFLDTEKPDDVILESSLTATDFAINAYGKTDLSKINSAFVYIPFEEGKAQRSIIVGPSNPNFVPIGQVSPYLKNAILTAEDPSFFSHKGFVPQALRASIATNFKEKAFKRGGSTISMQLVKNVYLDREKTLARKIEEMLIVWLLEDNRIVSKERMFEVYLNIIEWGRGVYGVNEASHYYFSKRPSELNLGESIYLASIIPRPKGSLYRFDYTGHLKPFMASYFRMIGGLMSQRGFAEPDSTHSYGFYSVSLRDALRPAAPKVDSTEMDDESNFLEDEIKGVESMLEGLFKKRLDKEN